MSKNFTTDLQDGQKTEDEVYLLIMRDKDLHWNLTRWYSSSTLGRFGGWDLKVGYTIEVKHDIKSDTTGNIAFEYFNPAKNVPSGVAASKATYTVYVTKDYYLFFDTEMLKLELCDPMCYNSGYRNVIGGDNNNSSMHLFKLKYVMENFQSLRHIIKRGKQ